MTNVCRIRGRLISTPKISALKRTNVPFMRFFVAVKRPPRVAKGTGRNDVDFFQVVSYGQRARNDFPFLKKGCTVQVEEWMRMRVVPDGANGPKRRIYELVADNILFLRNISWDSGEERT